VLLQLLDLHCGQRLLGFPLHIVDLLRFVFVHRSTTFALNRLQLKLASFDVLNAFEQLFLVHSLLFLFLN
jgi:hypothetical protein